MANQLCTTAAGHVARAADVPTSSTFASLWDDRVSATPDATFLVFKQDDGETRRWTYGEFDEVVKGGVRLLRAHAISHGDAIHLALRNSPAFVALWLAASSLGAWFVPVDPASTERDLRRQMARTRPRVGFCASSRRASYEAAAVATGVAVVILHETIDDVDRLQSGAGSLAMETHAAREPAPGDRLAVMFTSGTTSEPKGVVLTQANYRTLATSMSSVAEVRPQHRWFVTLPMFHANGQYYCFAPAIAAGASVALTSRFSASSWVAQARELEVTHASLFAAPMRMILARTPAGTPPLDLQHLWFAQSLGRQHYDDFTALIGVAPRQLYGMTETVAIVTADDSVPRRNDVIGRPVLGRAVKLVGEEGGEVPDGQPGTIVVGGIRGVTLFAEYLDDVETTSRSFTNDGALDWFSTGDVAVRETTGVMRFVGRADDVIKVAGENVSLSEVEATLAQAPGVLEAAVIAKADAVRDQVPIAYVVPKQAGVFLDPAELDAWARMNLSPAARPREWHVIEALPRTSVGKVRRFAVTDG